MTITIENTKLEYSRVVTAKETGNKGMNTKREKKRRKGKERSKIRQIKWHFM